mmetsp:Transcript_1032/g.3590  ORF Transcript_1032/g.3590 Transcript_1032/m.3590 type:complete len:275 (+) Transcript_1032:1443-2267(+)
MRHDYLVYTIHVSFTALGCSASWHARAWPRTRGTPDLVEIGATQRRKRVSSQLSHAAIDNVAQLPFPSPRRLRGLLAVPLLLLGALLAALFRPLLLALPLLLPLLPRLLLLAPLLLGRALSEQPRRELQLQLRARLRLRVRCRRNGARAWHRQLVCPARRGLQPRPLVVLLRHEVVLTRAELPPSVLWHFHRRPRVALRLVALAAALAAAAASPVGVGQRLDVSRVEVAPVGLRAELHRERVAAGVGVDGGDLDVHVLPDLEDVGQVRRLDALV